MLSTGVLWTATASADEVSGAFTNIEIIEETSGASGRLQVEVAFTVPVGTVAGDTATLTVSAPYRFVNLTFDVLDPDTGEVVGTVTVVNSTATLTFTDYVERFVDISGAFILGAFFEAGSVGDGDVVDATFETEGESFTDTVTIVPVEQNELTTFKRMRFTDPGTEDALSWVIQVSTLEAVPNVRRTVVIRDSPQEGNEVDCDSVTSEPLNIAIAPNNDGSPGAFRAIPATSIEFECGADRTGRGFILRLVDIDPNTFIRVRGNSIITDPTRGSYRNNAQVQVFGAEAETISDNVRRFVGSGEAQGTAPTPTPTPTPTPSESTSETPTPTPTPSESTSVTPTPSPTPSELAATGASTVGPMVATGAALVLLGFALVMVSAASTRRARQH